MIHRYLHYLLTEGIAAINQDLTILESFFRDTYDTEEAEIAAIKTYWQANPLNVVTGYPRTTSKFPLVAIVLAQEAETTNFIGDVTGQITDELDPFYGADTEGSIWQHTYQLLTYSDHPDVTSYYYELIKYILLENHDYLTNKGLFDYKYSGADLAPDPAYLPAHLFARVLTFSCQRENSIVDRSSRFGKAFAVRGIHVDSSGSNSDVGEVDTNVTPYILGED